MKKKGSERKESRTEQAADRGMIKDKKAFVKRLNVRRQ